MAFWRLKQLKCRDKTFGCDVRRHRQGAISTWRSKSDWDTAPPGAFTVVPDRAVVDHNACRIELRRGDGVGRCVQFRLTGDPINHVGGTATAVGLGQRMDLRILLSPRREGLFAIVGYEQSLNQRLPAEERLLPKLDVRIWKRRNTAEDDRSDLDPLGDVFSGTLMGEIVGHAGFSFEKTLLPQPCAVLLGHLPSGCDTVVLVVGYAPTGFSPHNTLRPPQRDSS